ncbi:MAG: hypothetical protein WCP86_11680 [bacterium]
MNIDESYIPWLAGAFWMLVGIILLLPGVVCHIRKPKHGIHIMNTNAIAFLPVLICMFEPDWLAIGILCSVVLWLVALVWSLIGKREIIAQNSPRDAKTSADIPRANRPMLGFLDRNELEAHNKGNE